MNLEGYIYNNHLFYWIFFNIGILLLLALDLWNSYKKTKAPTFRQAVLASLFWIGLALLFNLWVYFALGMEAAISFLAGYLLEKSLSIDNLFVFLLIFTYFKVPSHLKHRILFYGVLGAIIMRALLIVGGIAFIRYFSWSFYIFGIFLIFIGIKLAFQKIEEFYPERSFMYRLFIRLFPAANPLIFIIFLIEATDLIFALDSVPAIFGITLDPFIIYTSNILAILGLRSLFFILEPLMLQFHLLHYALSLILVLIGIKMLMSHWISIPTAITLASIIILIAFAIIGSLLFPLEKKKQS